MSASFHEEWQRGTVLLVSLIALGIVGAILVYLFTSATPAPRGDYDLYGDTPLDATLLRLDRDTLRDAYQAQLLKLWGVWLTSGAPNDAVNFKTGMNNARRAYGLAAQALNKRERELLEEEQRAREQTK